MVNRKNSNETRRQHYVPCCYLKFFSDSGSWEAGRNTCVWFTDGNKSKCVAVKCLAAKDYTYSKEFPEFDDNFGKMESDYPRIIEKVLAGEAPTKREYFGLVIMMADFNLRNIAYVNQTDRERKDVYTEISRPFIEEMFAEAEGKGTDMQGIKDWLQKHWVLKRLETESGVKFITSDNPSKVFFHPSTVRPVFIYLPVHPNCAVIAYDNRHINVISNKVNDVGVLNGLQATRCVRQVYADHDTLTENVDDAEKLRILLERDKPERYVSNDGLWQHDFISIESSVFNSFSFVKRRDRVNPILRDAIRRVISDRDN